LTIFTNNLKRIFKSKGNLIIMFILPMVFITLFMANSFSGSKIAVGVIDKDHTKYTAMLVNYIKTQNDVVTLEEKDIKSKLISGRINYALVIDKGFTHKIINNTEVDLKGYSIQETNISLPTKYYIDSFINSSKNIGKAAKGNEEAFYEGIENYQKGSFQTAYTDFENRKAKGVNTVTGLGFLIMSMIFLSNNTAQLVLDDKKNKTFFRIFAAPISTKNYMLQNILSFFAILFIQLVVIFSIMTFVFKAYFGPSVLNVFILFAIFSAVCVSLGVAIASIAKDSRQAGTLSTFITVPMCMLGGCFWQREMMPDLLQKIGNFMPTTWVLKATNNLVDGGSLTSVYMEIGILLLFTLVFILLGSWKKADITK
jgi:ABC-2 type transport system permease protein